MISCPMFMGFNFQIILGPLKRLAQRIGLGPYMDCSSHENPQNYEDMNGNRRGPNK